MAHIGFRGPRVGFHQLGLQGLFVHFRGSTRLYRVYKGIA